MTIVNMKIVNEMIVNTMIVNYRICVCKFRFVRLFMFWLFICFNNVISSEGVS